MGCVHSKESENRHLHERDDYHDMESRHVVSLTSSSYGLLNMERPSSSSIQGSFLCFHRKSRKYQALVSSHNVAFSPGLDAEHVYVGSCKSILRMDQDDIQSYPLLHNHGRVNTMETINTWELMEGLEDRPPSCQGSGNQKLGLASTHLSNSLLDESGSPVWKKYYTESESVKEGLAPNHISPLTHLPSSPFHESPARRAALACMPFVKSIRRLPSCSSLCEPDDSKSTSSNDLPKCRSSPGLKLLLTPAKLPPSYMPPLPNKAGSIHGASLSFDGNTENLSKTSHVKFKRSFNLRKKSSRQHSMDCLEALDVPLFDPSLMAKFELAITATVNCTREDLLQHSTDEITTNSSSSDNTWPSSAEMVSDAESLPLWHTQEKRICAQTTPSVIAEKKDAAGLLSKYEVRCPSQGDGKVVLYHTSLRGVRKTFEDCCTVRVILKGLGICVDERDVWMHAKYKEELLDALGDILKSVPLVPQLFIKGRYVGGAEEVKRLHENGSLASLMDGISMQMFCRVCDGCGDVRFVPCLKCNGSCKVRNRIGEVSRCLVCNENGLIICSMCTALA